MGDEPRAIDAEGALEAIEKHKVTHGQFVPAMFTRMLKLPEQVRTRYDVSSLKRVIHAAAPCPVEVKKAMMDWWGPIVDEYYASSEAIGATFIFAEDWLKHPGSVGKPMTGNTRSWMGMIDEVRLYNYALSETELRRLYEQTGGEP